MTIRRYETPAAFKEAPEHRLRERTAAGTIVARTRQLLVFDRFLARIAAVFGDAAILKGGVALELRIDRARTTKDIAPPRCVRANIPVSRNARSPARAARSTECVVGTVRRARA